MSFQLSLGLWLLLCAALGAWRTSLRFRKNPDTYLWQIEGMLSLLAFGLGAVLVVDAVFR
jgi:hypothetical protein